MKLWMQLMAAMLLVAVLPVVFLTRYATTYFHYFTREAQEEQMSQAGMMVTELFRSVPDATERRKLLEAYSARSGRRYRFYDSDSTLLLDVGDLGEIDFGDNRDVARALESGGPSARWWLRPDRSSLFYFVSVPLKNEDGDVLGVAQVIEDTNRITRALSRLHDQQLGGVWWIAGGCVVFSAGFSWLLTRRLRRLRTAALQFGATGALPNLPEQGRDEVADLARGFRQMATELKKRHAYNRDFVLTTLHELKTPLTAMHGAADLLYTRETLSAEDRKRFAGNIQHQSTRMLGLVKELQTLTSLDVDLPEEQPEEVDIETWLPDVVERLRPGLLHPVDISLEKPDAGPVIIVPHRIEQALANLLNNADRYQPEGLPLQVIFNKGDSEWTLSVRDQGPGIEEENLDRIFDRYFSTVPRDQPGSAGRGLGLSVVRRIAEHHHGTVHAHNARDRGAVVGFSVPTDPRTLP
jgi:signal transduction histidine kinase